MDVDLSGFVQSIAMSEAFQNRLFSMSPLRAAAAAGLSLLGRASTPAEVSEFLITRARDGQQQATLYFLAVLKGVAWIGEAVIKSAHHWGSDIRGGSVHKAANAGRSRSREHFTGARPCTQNLIRAANICSWLPRTPRDGP